MWRLFKEGTGVGVQQRLAHVILGRSGQPAAEKVSVLQQFMRSAAVAIARFGPGWARGILLGKPVGVWLLVMCWILFPVLVLLACI